MGDSITFHSLKFENGNPVSDDEWTVPKGRFQAVSIGAPDGYVYIEGVQFSNQYGIRVSAEDAIRIKQFIS